MHIKPHVIGIKILSSRVFPRSFAKYHIFMNSIYIVLPILTVLMFDLGLTLQGKDFLLVLKRGRAVIAGLLGQLVVLPLIAWALAAVLDLSPLMTIGLVLIACCPGGSSSNVFSKLAKGDVALSVSLTAVSSIVDIFVEKSP